MSYEDSNRQGGYGGSDKQQGGYTGAGDEREYGGGGSGGNNYYDQSKQYNDEPRRHEGRQEQHSHGGNSDEFSGVAQHASSHAGDSGDMDLFSTALGMLSGKKSKLQNEDIDEDDAVNQHQKFYGGGEGHQQASSSNVGAAAAMQALKMFTGGTTQEAHGGAGQSKFIGLAMAQAAKLFDQQASQGKTHPDATKQDAISQAAQMALKMYMKGGTGSAGGGSSGGGIMGLASKFLK